MIPNGTCEIKGVKEQPNPTHQGGKTRADEGPEELIARPTIIFTKL
jgi:hypothetical protein